jgi:hypothetical protein
MTNSLSGLFCASLSFMHTPTGHKSSNSILNQTDPAVLPFRPQAQSFSPNRSFPSWTASSATQSGRMMRHSILAGETVCTENLTPWIKLLPCRTHVRATNFISACCRRLSPWCTRSRLDWALYLRSLRHYTMSIIILWGYITSQRPMEVTNCYFP